MVSVAVLAGQAFERHPGILFRVESSSIDRQQVIAFVDVGAAAPENVALERIVCRPIIDFANAVRRRDLIQSRRRSIRFAQAQV
jgi:hypothetical protein